MSGKVELKRSPFNLTDQEIKELREAFNMFDKCGAGTIDAEEVRVTLRVLGYDATDEEVHQLLKDFDHDHSSSIDFDEFTQIIAYKLSEMQPISQLVRAFHFIDRDGDDMISLSDLTEVAESLGEVLDIDLKQYI